ncbi:MAG TPA: Uma2 family endonuclease [Chloroflexota bacterium]|nr:Uma2 family endonuclease [Chloroflexota bacterium]
MVQLPTKRQFTVTEYRRIADAGVFTPDDRVELLEGEIIEMPPIGSRHAACVDRLNRLFSRLAGGDVVVRIQNPLLLSDRSEPLPDVQLLSGSPERYVEEHPRPADVLLLVEVSDTSLQFDRVVKLPAYAAAGIQEVWIVDLAAAQVEVYRDPLPDGYQSRTLASGEDQLTPQALPSFTASVRQIIG